MKQEHKSYDENYKKTIVNLYESGKRKSDLTREYGISYTNINNWIKKYDELGYNGLVQSKKGRPPKDLIMRKRKTMEPKELTESEKEELIRLRAENEYIKTEIEVLKKEIALREENYAAQLKAKKQRSSKNLESKDTN